MLSFLLSSKIWYNSSMTLDDLTQRKIEQYLARARQALDTGQLVMAHGDILFIASNRFCAK
jgi:hypothetical protein